MRFHCLGVPHTVTNHDYVGCAFTQKVLKFCKMMKAPGHYIIHYGHEDSKVDCDEHVTVVTNKDLEIAYSNYDWRKNFYKYELNDHAYKTFYNNAIEEVGKRKQKFDFILPFWGQGVKAICDAHQDMICVEPGIGYPGGTWARWRVYESYALLHSDMGMKGVSNCKNDWYHVVIPNYFDPDDFEYSEEKEDYALFLGRICSGKGIEIVLQVTKAIGIKLKVAGQGDLTQYCENGIIPDNVEYIGYADLETRKKLMSKAKFGIISSMYTEPFGGVQVEFLLSGTPTITTDWGAFVENNVHGVTGYRCRTFEQFCWAAKNIDTIKPIDCRNYAMNNFTLEKVGGMYEEYFNMVMNVYKGNGWYEPNEQRQSLDWLNRNEKENNIICQEFDNTPFEMRKITYFPHDPKNKNIAIWGPPGVYDNIIEELKYDFNILFCDWTLISDCNDLWNRPHHFDLIIGDLNVVFQSVDKGFIPELTEDIKKRLLIIHGTNDLLDKELPKGIKYCGTTTEISNNLKGPRIPQKSKYWKFIINKMLSDKPNIGIWTDGKWSLGILHNDISHHLKDYYNIYIFDWANAEEGLFFWDNWKEFDIILGNTALTYEPVKCGYIKELSNDILKKIISVFHAELVDHSLYTERINFKNNEITYGATSINGYEFLKNNTNNIDINLLPNGVDIENFYKFKNITEIKKIGIVFRGPLGDDIKRPEMAIEIAEKCGLELVFLHGKDFTEHYKIYSDIDLLICTSISESCCLPILEASACNIPVISTKVGCANELKNIKTFDTVDEAVELINSLKNNFQEYTDKLTNEVRTERNWEYIAKKYWKPVFDNKLQQYKFLEIGVCDFDYSNDNLSFLIEPVETYFNRIITKGKKINCAVTHNKTSNYCDIYYIPIEIIEKHNLPNWLRGCNSINTPHFQHKKEEYKNYVVKNTIKLINVNELFELYNFKNLESIKIDTEGHDCIIMMGLYDFYNKNMNTHKLPKTIKFESNHLSVKEDVDNIISNFVNIGYKVNKSDHDTILHLLS